MQQDHGSMDGPPLVIVVDDDAAVRGSLNLFLTASGFRCTVHESAEAVLAEGVPRDAGCLVVDLRMPGGMDGVELIERLRQAGNATPALVVSGHGDIAQAVRAMRAGASDFIEKPYDITALAEAIHRAMAEPKARRGTNPAAEERLSHLTAREREVLTALAEGEANKVIARRLGISSRTVEVHRAHLMQKLQVKSLGEAVRVAVAAGLVD